MRPFRLAKFWTKATAAELFYRTGLFSLLAKRRLNGRAVVLMYHRVLPSELASRSFSHPGIIVTPGTFAKHMAFLKKNFRPLTLAEFQEHMESGTPFPDRACLVTFDDGWFDNHDFALPILREHSVPAVVFVATDYIESDRPFWQEHLGHLLFESVRNEVGASALRGHGIELPRNLEDAALRGLIADTIDQFRQESYEQIDNLIRDLTEALNRKPVPHATLSPDRFMTWAQLEELKKYGVAVASHTCSHRQLTRVSTEDVDRELRASRVAVDARLSQSTTALAYPGGKYNSGVKQLASTSGYNISFSTERGAAGIDNDPFVIPRINVCEPNSHSIPLFMARMIQAS